MLKPALALVSMNSTPNSRALASPSSMDTCLWEARPPKVLCEPWNARVRVSYLRVSSGDRATDDALRRAPYVPLINKIGLVPNQHDYDVATALSAHLLHPARSVKEGGAVCEWKKSNQASLSETMGGCSPRPETEYTRTVGTCTGGVPMRAGRRAAVGRAAYSTRRTPRRLRRSRGYSWG